MPRYVLIAVFLASALVEVYGLVRHFEKPAVVRRDEVPRRDEAPKRRWVRHVRSSDPTVVLIETIDPDGTVHSMDPARNGTRVDTSGFPPLDPEPRTWNACCERDMIGVWGPTYYVAAYRQGHDYNLCWGPDPLRSNAVSWEGVEPMDARWWRGDYGGLVVQIAGKSQWQLWPTLKRRW